MTLIGKDTQVTVTKQEWIPPEIQADTTEGHEALHAGIAEVPKWVSARPGKMGGLHYRGITVFGAPPGPLARLGPAVMGGRGTSFDESNGADGHTRDSVAGSVHAEVNRQYGEIAEIQEDLKRFGSLTSSGVIQAKKRARTRRQFGEFATVSAKTSDGSEISTKVKVEGDSAAIPIEIISFTTKKETEQEAKTKKEASETENDVIQSFEDIVTAENARIQDEKKLQDVRAELASLPS